MSKQSSEDSGKQEAAGEKFNRGSTLSVFHSDRTEDFMALFFALAVALGVYLAF
jgi:hypothetical protein